MLLPALSRARERARIAVCMSNLKQIGIAFSLYVNDWDGYFPAPQITPASASTGYKGYLWWTKWLLPYVKNVSIYECLTMKKLYPNEYCWMDDSKQQKVWYTMNAYLRPPEEAGTEGSSHPERFYPKISLIRNHSWVAVASEGHHYGYLSNNYTYVVCHNIAPVNPPPDAVQTVRWTGSKNFLFLDGHVENIPCGYYYTDPYWGWSGVWEKVLHQKGTRFYAPINAN